jgi:alpha,alpha-trehalase
LDAAHRKELAVFLDYDGTLTPLIDDPSIAYLDPDSRSILQQIKGLYPLTIVSGRDTSVLKRLVGVEGIAYAGSHGHEIEYEDGTTYQHQDSVETLGVLGTAETRLEEELAGIADVTLERKGFAIAVHTRGASESARMSAYRVVEQLANTTDGLVMTSGKDVRELRPDNVWNKGTAIAYLIETRYPHRRPLFIGDDVTDEDGFTAVRDLDGISVIVGLACARETAAEFELQGPSEVIDFLRSLLTQPSRSS